MRDDRQNMDARRRSERPTKERKLGHGAHDEPLRPLVFQILLLLNESELHGYGIMQAVNEGAGHNVILGPATLYRTLKELRDQGLIEECPTDDERRKVYRLSDEGRHRASAEAKRMAAIVERARSGRLI